MEIKIGDGRGHFHDPLATAKVDYDDAEQIFVVTVGRRWENLALVFNRGEQRFEGEVAADATEEQRTTRAHARWR